MLTRIVEISLRHGGVVMALAAVLLVYGSLVTRQVKLDVFPEFVQPQVSVQTEAPGLAPEQVEALVTRPVEAAVNGAGELENVRSDSIQGLSVITAVFKESADVFRARQTLAERLGELAGTLPQGVKAPKMTPMTSSTMDLLKIGLVSKKLSPMELRTFADWTLRPRLLAVPGVAKCSVFGGEVRQLQVIVKPERLLAFDLSVKDVIDAATAATGVRGAGFVETDAQRVLIETEGQTLTSEALGTVMLTRSNGATVRLADVARVVIGAEPKFGDSLVQGEPGVLLTMSGQFGANTMEVTQNVEAALAEMKPAFTAAGIQLYPRLHRPATFIETALANVKSSLLFGGALVAIVLFLFLLDFRTALISFLSIPLSLVAAVLVLDRFGVSINIMTLGGFAVAIGVVVDDAIIDVENIVRRLRENARLAEPRPAFSVVLDASIEVRSAVVYATFIVAIVFVPVLMMSGLQGRFFAPLGVAFILSVGASLLVALTVTPALCLALLPRTRLTGEPRWVHWLKGRYEAALRGVHGRPAAVLVSALILLAGACVTIPFFGGELLPEFREGHFVQVSTIPGTSLPETLRLGKRISAALLENEHIATVEQQIGRAELGEDTWGTNRGEFHIELKPTSAEEQEEVQKSIRETLVQMAYQGAQVAQVFNGSRVEQVAVLLEESERRDPETIGTLLLSCSRSSFAAQGICSSCC
jgi:Cu/Ag efflux pump CusA